MFDSVFSPTCLPEVSFDASGAVLPAGARVLPFPSRRQEGMGSRPAALSPGTLSCPRFLVSRRQSAQLLLGISLVFSFSSVGHEGFIRGLIELRIVSKLSCSTHVDHWASFESPVANFAQLLLCFFPVAM